MKLKSISKIPDSTMELIDNLIKNLTNEINDIDSDIGRVIKNSGRNDPSTEEVKTMKNLLLQTRIAFFAGKIYEIAEIETAKSISQYR